MLCDHDLYLSKSANIRQEDLLDVHESFKTIKIEIESIKPLQMLAIRQYNSILNNISPE